MDPSLTIFHNSAALNALKRPQLVALAKSHGLSAGGKNADLVARLEAYGAQLALQTGEEDSMMEADASWAVLKEDAAYPTTEQLAEFGVQEQDSNSRHSSWRSKASITKSASSGSIASTIHSAGNSLLRAFTDPSSSSLPAQVDPSPPTPKAAVQPSIPSIYPSLDQAFEQSAYPRADELEPTPSSEAEYEGGGIRMVSSRSTVHSLDRDESDGEEEPPVPVQRSAASTPAFVFGSPIQNPASPPSTFSFAMPGSLFSSTSSTLNGEAAPETGSSSGKTAAELVMEEMNRRAAEARAANGGMSSLAGSSSTLMGGRKLESPSKGSKAAFDASHKRAFAQMDSIVNHPSARRLHPSTSSSNLLGMPRSTTSRTLSASAASAAPTADDRAPKRLKPYSSRPINLNRVPPSTSSKKLVDGLRAGGWSTAPTPATSVSLTASLRAGPSTGSGKGKEKTVREDLQPVQEQEKEQKKRQLEMAKARRKSQVASGLGLGKRRTSMIIGPKATGSTAPRFFKSTLKKFAPSVASSSRPIASTSALPTTVPRFAASTASTSSRNAVPSAIPSAASPVASLRKQPGWKKFDLSESLKRPMSWKSGGSMNRTTSTSSISSLSRPSAAFAAPSSVKRPAALSRNPSSRVANSTLLSAVKPSQEAPIPEEAPSTMPSSSYAAPNSTNDPFNVAAKLAALPSAPSTVFGAPSPSPYTAVAPPLAPFLPLTNTLSPPLPSAISTSAAKKRAFAPPSSASGKKPLSSASRLARGGDKAKGRAQVEGLESRARKVQAKAGVGAGRGGPGRK